MRTVWEADFSRRSIEWLSEAADRFQSSILRVPDEGLREQVQLGSQCAHALWLS